LLNNIISVLKITDAEENGKSLYKTQDEINFDPTFTRLMAQALHL
jgi:hypothetical protein